MPELGSYHNEAVRGTKRPRLQIGLIALEKKNEKIVT